MFNLNSNRRWKRNMARQYNLCRAARRPVCIPASLILITADQSVKVPVSGGIPLLTFAPSLAMAASSENTAKTYSRPYVGQDATGAWVMVRSTARPDGLQNVRGPFKTTRGAQYMIANPNVVKVSEAEKLSIGT